MKYRTGTIFNQKYAYRYGFSLDANSPICPCTDIALHILSGCQHTKNEIAQKPFLIQKKIALSPLQAQAIGLN
jgi:hypothetical protein